MAYAKPGRRSPEHLLLAVLWACAAMSSACSGDAVQGRSPRRQAGGSIAYNHRGSIRLADMETGASRILVENNTYDRPLAWMPGGGRLLYWNHDDGAWDIWAVDPESKDARNLTGTARDSRSPAPSPDGRRIAILRGGDGLWLMNADGSGQRRIDPRGHRDVPPAWSPSGRRLAFTDLESTGERTAVLQAYCIEFEDDGRPGACASLGPGEVQGFLGEEAVVLAASHGGRPELVAVDVGSNSRRGLTESPEIDHLAAFSPDRKRIAWIASGEDGSRLMAMDAGGGPARILCPVDNCLAPPSFSPGGRYIAFESGRDRGAAAVYVIAVDGGEPRAIAEPGSGFPVWRPEQ